MAYELMRILFQPLLQHPRGEVFSINSLTRGTLTKAIRNVLRNLDRAHAVEPTGARRRAQLLLQPDHVGKESTLLRQHDPSRRARSLVRGTHGSTRRCRQVVKRGEDPIKVGFDEDGFRHDELTGRVS